MLLPIQTTWINNNYNKQARVTKQSYRMESQDKFTKEPTVNYQFMKFMKKMSESIQVSCLWNTFFKEGNCFLRIFIFNYCLQLLLPSVFIRQFMSIGSEIWHPDCSKAAALNGELDRYPVSTESKWNQNVT